MFQKIAGIFSRKVIVTVIMLVFAVVATTGGIKYYRYKAIQPVLQSRTYQTAVGLVELERYPKLALSPEQALNLLPVIREMAANPQDIANDEAKAQTILNVLNTEQKDFIKNMVIPGSQKNRWGFKEKRNNYRSAVDNLGKGGRNRDNRFEKRFQFKGRTDAGGYGYVLQILLQKAYS